MSDQTKPMLPGLPEPAAYTTQVADGYVLYLPRFSLNVEGMIGVLTADQVRAIQLAAWKAGTEQIAQQAQTKADNIRRSNTYRGKVNQTAEYAAGLFEDFAAAIRQAPEPGEGG